MMSCFITLSMNSGTAFNSYHLPMFSAGFELTTSDLSLIINSSVSTLPVLESHRNTDICHWTKSCMYGLFQLLCSKVPNALQKCHHGWFSSFKKLFLLISLNVFLLSSVSIIQILHLSRLPPASDMWV